MLVCFKLSMPGVSSWNGKWSGRDNLYAKVLNLKSQPNREYYSYDFGDGWRAGISVSVVDSKEARKLRTKSQGFYGYDWMIDSIIKHDKIITGEK